MLQNPFTPTEIASAPDEFFGRAKELSDAKTSLNKGSVTIQGPIGIGKSSLLARTRLEMEGYNSDRTAQTAVAVGHVDIASADDMARAILESMIEVDEKQRKMAFRLGSLAEFESSEIYRNFVSGRNVAALSRLLEREYMKQMLGDNRELFVVAIDEADKCPVAIARLLRQVATYGQQNGIKNVRFLLAGVSPFYQQMISEDSGIARFIYKTIMLAPMDRDEATDLVETKLGIITEDARSKQIEVEIDPQVIPRIVGLSGGHPHLLQLLGSYIVENENTSPDGLIDAVDLTTALQRICYEDRAQVYDSIIHKLEVQGQLEAFRKLITIAAPQFPTRITKREALKVTNAEALQSMFDHNVLGVNEDGSYRLLDEFLRVRLLMDAAEDEDRRNELSHRLLGSDWIVERVSDY